MLVAILSTLVLVDSCVVIISLFVVGTALVLLMAVDEVSIEGFEEVEVKPLLLESSLVVEVVVVSADGIGVELLLGS